MYLQLTGRERDLVGYWRLGGIAIDEDNQHKVIDFSVNNNDGIVYGDPYVSAVTLNRKLGDKDATEYSNNGLFAVTQGGSYTETFEFKINSSSTVDPNKVDGNNKKIFLFNYWGKKNHHSKDTIPFTLQEPGTQIEEVVPGSDWYKASCSFTVPKEINLVRSFGIYEVTGVWDSLEIRKHHICKTSDTITETVYTDKVVLFAKEL